LANCIILKPQALLLSEAYLKKLMVVICVLILIIVGVNCSMNEEFIGLLTVGVYSLISSAK